MRTIADDTRRNILQEQYIPDNVFIYVVKGAIRVFDGNKSYSFEAGDACLARKNRLAKYEILDSEDEFEPILFCFDEPFLQKFQDKGQSLKTQSALKDTNSEIGADRKLYSINKTLL